MTAVLNDTESFQIRDLTAKEYEQFRKLSYEQFGLDLQDGKQQMVAARLAKQIRMLGLHSYEEYYQQVIQDKTGKLMEAMIDALTTNHTSFFREAAHF